MENKKELTTTQKVIVGTISSIGMIACYTGGVNLARSNPKYHNPIFISTIMISFISPYMLNSTITYLLKKYNTKKNKQLKK